MSQFFSEVLVGFEAESLTQTPSLWYDDELVFSHDSSDDEQVLNALVFKVRRKPRDLRAHLRRIYFCYQKRLQPQLYAALLDLLLILQGKGQAISRRMIVGSRAFLDAEQISWLNRAANGQFAGLGSCFSLFTSGLLGKCELVEIQRQEKQIHDFLVLANDFIEYSQLEEAMDVLESGVTASPERSDLQEALLELYKSTKNIARFKNFHSSCLAGGLTLVDDWQLLAEYFEGLV